MNSKKGGNGSKGQKLLDFHYLKTPSFRSYHVDGALGGFTPSGDLYMELFVERYPTPQTVRYKLSPEGRLEGEISRTGKDGIIREVEAAIIMNMNTATTLRDWLDKRIKEFQTQNKPAKKRS